MGVTGLEQTAKTPGKSHLVHQSAAESGAVEAANGKCDPNLQLIVDRWPQLPDAIKAGIIAMVRAAGPT